MICLLLCTKSYDFSSLFIQSRLFEGAENVLIDRVHMVMNILYFHWN